LALFNEGMSDIWGMIMEYRIRPNSVWKIGEQIMNNGKTCLRNFQTPSDLNAQDQIAVTYGTTLYNSTDNRYFRSGVFSHWFYRLVNGGSGTNGLGNSYLLAGIGMDHAEEIIAECVFGGYFSNTTSYAAIRQATIAVAEQIYGNNSIEKISVTNAWYAVGVGTAAPAITISVINSDVLCSGQSRTFTVANAPDGYSWSKSSNLTLVNYPTSNSVTYSGGNANGPAWVSVSINDTELARKELYVGLPNYGEITANLGQTGLNRYEAMAFWQNDNYLPLPSEYPVDQYQWTLSPSSSGWTMTQLSSPEPPAWSRVRFSGTASSQSATVYVRGHNTCGYSGLIQVGTISAGGSGGLIGYVSAYPNPVSDILTVSMDADKYAEFKNAALSESGAVAKKTRPTFTISLFDLRGAEYHRTTTAENIRQIDVSDLAAGIYTLRIVDDITGKAVTNQIIVN
jgi:hypothetical protein